MSDGPDSLVLRFLRTMDAKIDRMSDDIHDLRDRVAGVERAVLADRRDRANDAEQVVHIQVQVDRLTDRVSRMERRLEIAD